ncbi:MAG: tetratricopeptide repeat protein [Bacteroidia bacterium]
MRRVFTYIYLSICGVSLLFAQKPDPESALKFPYNTTENTVAQKMRESGAIFNDADWKKVEDAVRRNNQTVESSIREIDTKMDELYRQMKQLQSASNVVELQNNLKALKDARAKMKETTEKQLQQVGFKGLYLVVVGGVSPYDTDTKNTEKVRSAVLPEAIATMNGTFIQSMTELRDLQVEYDEIKEKISGSMTLGQTEYEDRSFSAGYFVQIRQVEVFPLQQKIQEGGDAGSSTQNVKVFDLLNNPNIASQLAYISDASLRAKIEAQLNERVPGLSSELSTFNQTSTRNEKNIIEDAKEKLAEQDRKIKAAQEEITQNMENAKKIITSTGATFDANNLVNCIADAKKRIQSKLETLKNDKFNAKANELIITPFDVSAQGGDPASSLAKEALSKISVVNNAHSQLKGFVREITVTNNVVTDFNTGTASDAFRELETFWMYPVPAGSLFRLNLVSKFKMLNKTSPSVASSTPPPLPPKEEPKPKPTTTFTPKSGTSNFTLDDKLKPEVVQKDMNEAENYFNARDYETAFPKYFKYKSSQYFSSRWQAQLGFMYSGGLGVKQDAYEAIKWFRKAAEGGNAMGQYHLGTMYEVGRTVPPNSSLAASWYEKAANQDFDEAQWKLGFFYEYGIGVGRSNTDALRYYRLAAAKGNVKAKEALKRLGAR